MSLQEQISAKVFKLARSIISLNVRESSSNQSEKERGNIIRGKEKDIGSLCVQQYLPQSALNSTSCPPANTLKLQLSGPK